MRGIRVTLVGMRFYDRDFFISRMKSSIAKQGAFIEGFIKADTNYDNAIEVYFESPSRAYARVATIATSSMLLREDTVNGIEIRKLMEKDKVYPVLIRFDPDSLEGVLQAETRGESCSVSLSPVQIHPDTVYGSSEVFRGPSINSFHEIIHRAERMKNLEVKEIINQPRGHTGGTWTAQEGMVMNCTSSQTGKTSFSTTDSTMTAEGLWDTVMSTSPHTIKLKDHSAVGVLEGVYIDGKLIGKHIQTTTKGRKNPMKNMNSMFSKFGKDFAFPTSNFAMSMFGGLAVKQGNSYVTYDMEKNEATDVMDFVMDGFSEMVMILPSQELKEGDVFIQDGKVYHKLKDNKAYSYADNTVETLVNKSNIMGFKMYAKVFNMMANFAGNTEGGAQNMFANPMFMMMMMKDGDSDMSDMMQMMMMSQMFQGGFKL